MAKCLAIFAKKIQNRLKSCHRKPRHMLHHKQRNLSPRLRSGGVVAQRKSIRVEFEFINQENSRVCIRICYKRNSCEKHELCVSNSRSMVLRIFHACVCALTSRFRSQNQRMRMYFPDDRMHAKGVVLCERMCFCLISTF